MIAANLREGEAGLPKRSIPATSLCEGALHRAPVRLPPTRKCPTKGRRLNVGAAVSAKYLRHYTSEEMKFYKVCLEGSMVFRRVPLKDFPLGHLLAVECREMTIAIMMGF